MEDNVPLNAAAVGFQAYSRSFETLVDNLIKKGLHPEVACRYASDISGQFLHFTNNSKFADNMAGADIAFIPEEDME